MDKLEAIDLTKVARAVRKLQSITWAVHQGLMRTGQLLEASARAQVADEERP